MKPYMCQIGNKAKNRKQKQKKDGTEQKKRKKKWKKKKKKIAPTTLSWSSIFFRP